MLLIKNDWIDERKCIFDGKPGKGGLYKYSPLFAECPFWRERGGAAACLGVSVYAYLLFLRERLCKVEQAGGGFLITASGDLNPIMKIISRHIIADIDIAHASLEDVFMKFYERKK